MIRRGQLARPLDFQRLLPWLGGLFGALALALLLAWVSDEFQGLTGWPSFVGVVLVGAAILWLGWRLLAREELPRYLAFVLLGAALLRLLAGAAWFAVLPQVGYDSKAELSGYIMIDAYERDRTAWDLAHSDKPLLDTFRGQRKADQYGGLLFTSTVVYRVLGGEFHQPLLIVVITAAFSALAVIYTWAFARRAWNVQVANIAAVLLAVYPEAVLLGSSQMREPFLITLAAAAFYGLVRFGQERQAAGLAFVLGALFLSVPFSPPVAALLLATLILAAISQEGLLARGRTRTDHRRLALWLLLGGLAILVLAGLWISLRQFAPDQISDPLSLLSYWARKSAEWQVYLTRRASGWLQKLFGTTPRALHMPLLLGYGALQPFLPAALLDLSGSPFWRTLSIWRALGWTLLLPFLGYAVLRAFIKPTARGLTRSVSLIVWLVILIAAYRAGADQWDNPRYRAAFASLQVVMAAWAWVEYRRSNDPWLRRALVGAALLLAPFIPWYLRRYTGFWWPIENVLLTIGLGAALAALYILWDWRRVKRKIG